MKIKKTLLIKLINEQVSNNDYISLAKKLKKIVDKYKKFETNSVTVPSAPNSETFSALKSGNISIVSNFSNFLLAILIGKAIPYKIDFYER